MNILLITDCQEADRIKRYIDLEINQRFEVRYFQVENYREAWEKVSVNPFLFQMVYTGRLPADFAGRENDRRFDTEYLEKIYRRNSRVLFFMCTSRRYFRLEQLSVPYLLIMKHPVTRDQISELLKRASEIENMRYGRCESRVAVYHRGSILMIPSGVIRYVMKDRERIILVTECGQFINKRKMDEFAAEAGNRFLRCRESLLINVGHIISFQGGQLSLDDGKTVSVSRKYSKKVSQYFEMYNIFISGDENRKNDCINTINDVK